MQTHRKFHFLRNCIRKQENPFHTIINKHQPSSWPSFSDTKPDDLVLPASGPTPKTDPDEVIPPKEERLSPTPDKVDPTENRINPPQATPEPEKVKKTKEELEEEEREKMQ